MSEAGSPTIRADGYSALTRFSDGNAQTYEFLSGLASYIARLEDADAVTAAHVGAAARIAVGNSHDGAEGFDMAAAVSSVPDLARLARGGQAAEPFPEPRDGAIREPMTVRSAPARAGAGSRRPLASRVARVAVVPALCAVAIGGWFAARTLGTASPAPPNPSLAEVIPPASLTAQPAEPAPVPDRTAAILPALPPLAKFMPSPSVAPTTTPSVAPGTMPSVAAGAAPTTPAATGVATAAALPGPATPRRRVRAKPDQTAARRGAPLGFDQIDGGHEAAATDPEADPAEDPALRSVMRRLAQGERARQQQPYHGSAGPRAYPADGGYASAWDQGWRPVAPAQSRQFYGSYLVSPDGTRIFVPAP